MVSWRRLLKSYIIPFLVTEERYDEITPSEFPNELIVNVLTNKPIENSANGIYLFWALTSHTYYHFLLIKDDEILIIDMRKSFIENLKRLLTLMNHEEYSKDQIIVIIGEFIRINEINRKEGILWDSEQK